LFNAVTVVSPETKELDGVAATARFTAGPAAESARAASCAEFGRDNKPIPTMKNPNLKKIERHVFINELVVRITVQSPDNFNHIK
jgi:hypothetical protein